MKISEIWVYPIKALGGIQLKTSKALISGLELDRRMMLIDDEGTFVSQRSHPILATLGISLDNVKVTVFQKANPSNSITFNIYRHSSTLIIAKVWKSKVNSYIYPDEVNKWFSTLLEKDIRLVTQKTEDQRTRTLPFSPKKIDLSYADGYPYLFLSKASVEQLNSEIDYHVDIRQFRANIILEDCNPFDEDNLQKFQIGNADFRMVKPCKRCPVINIDQDTGESNKETTKHLSKTRRAENSIIFGMNAAIMHDSVINIGDSIVY